MKLSTRMTLAMVALALLTAVAVGGLTYRNLKAVMLPRAFTRSQLDLQLLTTELSSYAGGARQDITGFRTAVALKGIVRAHLAGGIDPVDGTTEAVWRQRMASRYATELAAKPAYEQFRMIAANGKELVRVDRSRVDGAVGIVPDTELQQKADRGYFQDALRLPADKIYVSPVESTRNTAPSNLRMFRSCEWPRSSRPPTKCHRHRHHQRRYATDIPRNRLQHPPRLKDLYRRRSRQLCCACRLGYGVRL